MAATTSMGPARISAGSLIRWTGRWANAFVTVSRDSADYYLRCGLPKTRVSTIWNGIDTAGFSYSGPMPGGSAVTVARLSPEKNIPNLLRAAAIVRDADPEFRLEIAGDGPCRLLDAVAAVPEVDVVQVELEDLVLGELLLEPAREERLPDLALVGALGVEEQVLDDLLRDRRAALARAPALEVHEHRAPDAQVVEPLVLVEAGVLGREDRELDVRRQLLDRHHRAPLDEELGEEGPVAREHPGDLGRVVGLELGDARKVRLVALHHAEERGDADDGEEHGGEREATEPAQDPALARALHERDRAFVGRGGLRLHAIGNAPGRRSPSVLRLGPVRHGAGC
mgnify:CR=1 FL=1